MNPSQYHYFSSTVAGTAQAIVVDMMFLNLPKPENVTTPLLVIGAQCDRAVQSKDVISTARAYGTEAELFPDMGHDMMLEPGWLAVAERIHSWLESTYIPKGLRRSPDQIKDQPFGV